MVELFKKVQFGKIIRGFGNFLSPIIYLSVWYLFIKLSSKEIPQIVVNSDTFLFLSFVVFVFGLVTKSTSWSIGHEKFGIKGDSHGKLISYHRGDSGDTWFDLFTDNPDLLEKNKDFIEKLTSKTKE
ncbi:MAG: hypothetical protein AAB909_04485 [Patescibacteria group bacterium]